MKKACLVLICAVLLLPRFALGEREFTLTSPAPQADAASCAAVINGGQLHLRAKPEKDAPSLGRYPSGTRLTVLYDGDTFCRVRTPDGKEGYMMKEFLSFEGALPGAEPPAPTPAPDLSRRQALARGIDPDKPMLALTFDDGPQPESLRVLNALNAHGARATFFILGRNIEGNEYVLAKIAEGGHELATHSWSHPNLTEISESAVRSQMTRTMDKILEVTGQQVRLMRPPYGAADRLSRRVLADLGLPVILWGVDSLDWKTRSARATAKTILKEARDGAIILCHDIWASTGEAMEAVVPELIRRGFQLVTVSEMMSFRDEPLRPGWEYSHFDRARLDPGLALQDEGAQPGSP
ncbi:MAG TPA: polysaccharide deacetylase family protein [Candidatus Limnocylindria bacterium]|nr:polysaccharide deacetylase family protein [Candidatus Limnocylindria bacterium]